MRGDRRNVMWRACIDLQRIMDDMLVKRAEIVGKRKRREDLDETLKKATRAVRTRSKKVVEF